MDASADQPQIGRITVDRAALREPGAELASVLGALEFEVPTDGVPNDTPPSGWRVVARLEHAVVLGTPIDDGSRWWRIAQVAPPRGGSRAAQVQVHPEPQPLRASRAERSRGLVLRWPDATRSEPDLDRLVVDVVNTGEHRWRDRQPGRHEISATLVDLAVRTESPLEVHLTAELIEQHQPKTGRPRPPAAEQRRAVEERLEALRALLAANAMLGPVLETVTTAASDADALLGIGELLACPPDAAMLVYNASLRRFGSESIDRLAREAEGLERSIEHGDRRRLNRGDCQVADITARRSIHAPE